MADSSPTMILTLPHQIACLIPDGHERQVVADMRLRGRRPAWVTRRPPAGDCYAQHTCLPMPVAV
jgi:hypothetical protein